MNVKMSRVWSLINGLYGQLRGYDRLRIKRIVSANCRLSRNEIESRARGLMRARVCDAIAKFPEYARKVESFCGGLSETGYSDFQRLPIWTREDQRKLFENISSPPAHNSFVHSTGGSSGVPVRFCVTRESYEWRVAVSDRGYSWAGAEEGRKSFYVWGSPIKSEDRLTQFKKRLHHAFQRRTYFDSFDFSDDRKAECCRQINACRPESIVGYAGNLVELARFVRYNRNSLRWRAKTIVTAAEGLMPGQRELLQETLGDEVFRSYGSREFMLIGMECSQHRGYHVASDNLWVEVVDQDGKSVAPGETGRILVTDLHNSANPFIRYEIGDYDSFCSEPCACGLPFLLIADVEGRIQEVIHTPDGRKLTALFIPHLMKEFSQVEGYQLVQNDPWHLVVNLIMKNNPDDVLKNGMLSALKERLGVEMRLEVVRVFSLSKNSSGKTPIIMSEIK